MFEIVASWIFVRTRPRATAVVFVLIYAEFFAVMRTRWLAGMCGISCQAFASPDLPGKKKKHTPGTLRDTAIYKRAGSGSAEDSRGRHGLVTVYRFRRNRWPFSFFFFPSKYWFKCIFGLPVLLIHYLTPAESSWDTSKKFTTLSMQISTLCFPARGMRTVPETLWLLPNMGLLTSIETKPQSVFGYAARRTATPVGLD